MVSGDVRLRNLELKKEVRFYMITLRVIKALLTLFFQALDQMKLPLNVSEGHLGQLTLQ